MNKTGTPVADAGQERQSDCADCPEVRYPLTDCRVRGRDWGAYSSGRAKDGRPYHVGIDVRSRSGDPRVYATAASTVVAASQFPFSGNYVVIRHTIGGKTCYSFYAHLSRIVHGGGEVRAGTQIGTIGNTGTTSSAKYLHFALVGSFRAGRYYDCVPFFDGDKVTYNGVTFYSPHYVIANKRLP